MHPNDADTSDDPFYGLLAAYDAALATGLTPGPAETEPTERFSRARACLHELERRWPRSVPALAGALPDSAGRFGRFHIQRELGRGGCGIVLLAYDPSLRRHVALKIPRLEVVASSEMRQRFLREAHAAAGLDHPNIVPVFETGEVGPVAYITQAYCEGPTLAAWLKQRSEAVPARDAAELAAALADGVQHAHDRGILHRDLKPSNVLLQPTATKNTKSRDNEERKEESPGAGSTSALAGSSCFLWPFSPRITDFGLAKLIAEQTPGLSGPGESKTTTPEEGDATRTGALVGTARYMAPEQAEGKTGAVGRAADVWALGAILYEVLAGRPPFQGESDLATLRLVVNEEPVPVRQSRPDVPADLEAICLKCLEKEPRRRYGSAGELAEDLRRFLRGEPTRARPVGVAGRLSKWARRRPAAAALVAVCAGALVALMAGIGWHMVDLEKHNKELERLNTDLRTATKDAQDKQKLAEDRERHVRRNAYANQYRAAVQDWEHGRLVRAVERLDELRPEPGQDDLRGFEWYHLKGLCHPLRAVWRGPQRGVTALVVSPDGTLMAASDGDGAVHVRETATGRVKALLTGKWPGVRALTFASDGQTVLLATPGEGDLQLWDASSGKELAIQDVSGTLYLPLAVSPGGRTVAGVQRTQGLVLWDTSKRRHKTFCPGDDMVAVAFSPDGRTLAVGLGTGSVQLWDVATGEPRLVLRGHTGWVTPLAFSPDGRTLACGSHDQTVRLWNVTDGKLRTTLTGHRYQPTCLGFSPDGRTLAVSGHAPEKQGGIDELLIWDAASGTLLTRLDRHVGEVRHLAFLAESRTVVLGCMDGTVKLLDAGPAPRVEKLLGHAPKETWSLAFSPDGRTLASAGDDGLIRLWDRATGTQRAALGEHEKPTLVTAIAYSPDGRTIASASFDGTVKLWDASTGRLRATLTGAVDKLYSLAFSPNGRFVAAGGRDLTVHVWEASTGRELAQLEGHEKTVRAVVFAFDSQTLASAGADGKVRLWDTSTWDLRRRLDEVDEVSCLAYSPDGHTLAVGTRAGIVRLWDVEGGKEQAVLRRDLQEVHALTFSPDGRTLATAGKDGVVRLWQAATGEELFILPGHDDRINALAFSPDSRTLASADHTGAILLWPGLTSASVPPTPSSTAGFGPDGMVHVDPGSSPFINEVNLQPDGKILVTGAVGPWEKRTRDFLVMRLNRDGTADAGFGRDGQVVMDFNGLDDGAGPVLFLPNGKMLVGGVSSGRLVLVRCNPDGSADASFGQEGKVVTEYGRSIGIFSLGLQPEGKILAMGHAVFHGSGWDLVLARYRPDGSLDPAFGKGGLMNVDVFGDDDWRAMMVLPGGKVLVAGSPARGPRGDADVDFGAARLLADGSLDRTFGQDGKVRIDFFNNCDRCTGLAVQSDGKILLAGPVRGWSGFRFALVRLFEDGKPDPKFGREGKVTVPLSTNESTGAVQVAVQPDGKIVLAGYTGNLTHPFALARFTPDGRPDSTFGADGLVLPPEVRVNNPDFEKVGWEGFGSGPWACGLALQPDGKIVVAARGTKDGRPTVVVARYRPDGRPDALAVKVPAAVPGTR